MSVLEYLYKQNPEQFRTTFQILCKASSEDEVEAWMDKYGMELAFHLLHDEKLRNAFGLTAEATREESPLHQEVAMILDGLNSCSQKLKDSINWLVKKI